MSPETSRRPDSPTSDWLAERLREGPLRTLLSLHVRAGMLGALPEAEGDERLQKLAELLQLARMAMAQFQGFIDELQSLIDELAAVKREVQ